MVPFSFAGHGLAALAEGALYWPRRRALIVADLHLEKASWFAARGQMLPPYDSAATLAALTRAVERTGAREVWCLGDSFHDSAGVERLPAEVRAGLKRLIAARRWVWIAGNHDGAVTDGLGGEILDEAVVEGLTLRHEAVPGDPAPELSGHFHPKFRVQVRGRLVSRRCFLTSPTKIVLPAFGALTGGLDVRHPELVRAVGRDAEALVALEDRLLRFSVAA